MGSCCIPRGEQHSWLTWLTSRYVLQKLLGFLLGHPAAAECPAFASRRLPSNSQMLKHGRGFSPLTIRSGGRKEVQRASATSAVCWSISGAIGPPSPSPPGPPVPHGWSASPMGEWRQCTCLGGLITSANTASHEVRYQGYETSRASEGSSL